MVATAFQYWKGAPMRFDSSFSASVAGHTREASAYPTAATAAAAIPLSTTSGARGASRAAATAAANTAR